MYEVRISLSRNLYNLSLPLKVLALQYLFLCLQGDQKPILDKDAYLQSTLFPTPDTTYKELE